MTCPICGEYAADDDSEAHEACDAAEVADWNRGFGVVVYTGEEDAVGDTMRAAGRSLVRATLTVAGSGMLLAAWAARKFLGRDRL